MSHSDDDWEELDPEGPDAEDLARFGGETRPCPRCGHEVHDLADACPGCGHWLDDATSGAGTAAGWRSGLVWIVILGLAGVGWVVLRLVG